MTMKRLPYDSNWRLLGYMIGTLIFLAPFVLAWLFVVSRLLK
jgi:lipid-A-disaccharide synthase-like uncharacterized protein